MSRMIQKRNAIPKIPASSPKPAREVLREVPVRSSFFSLGRKCLSDPFFEAVLGEVFFLFSA